MYLSISLCVCLFMCSIYYIYLCLYGPSQLEQCRYSFSYKFYGLFIRLYTRVLA